MKRIPKGKFSFSKGKNNKIKYDEEVQKSVKEAKKYIMDVVNKYTKKRN